MKKTIGLLALLAAFPPLSTDMYLAAIPLLGDLWQQPLATINLTLVCFFITYCGFLLLYGPLSDRYGRRRPLLVGLCIYVAASLFCALADNVVVMIGQNPAGSRCCNYYAGQLVVDSSLSQIETTLITWPLRVATGGKLYDPRIS